ncbi:exo-alpha-sialidase [Chitinasiproducens palmae]|uniref:exo-alpha-sialidase n=1 Tax=Chitinasiproducens palmae TaxID=1770053 RepID=A0A1H2PQP7_9BURK|nr:sialidase family protein [Chitinasiproducens palmae]SDV49064.1 BNR repeat-like domain-containing protein [Chitinasiproducens palmae]
MAENVRLRDFDRAGDLISGGMLYADMGTGEVSLTLADLLRYFAEQGGGLVLVNGTPSSATGLDGQVAIDPQAGLLFGPKAGGLWPAGLPLRLSAEQVAFINTAVEDARSYATSANESYLDTLLAKNVWADVATGIANTAAGQVFGVISSASLGAIDLYRNKDGAGVATGKTLINASAVTLTETRGYIEMSSVNGMVYSSFAEDGRFTIPGYSNVQAALAKGVAASDIVSPLSLDEERGITFWSADGFNLGGIAPTGRVTFAGVPDLQGALEASGPAAIKAANVAQQRLFAKTLDASLISARKKVDSVALLSSSARGYGYRCPCLVGLSATRALLLACRLPNPNPFSGVAGGDYIGAVVVAVDAELDADAGTWTVANERVVVDNTGTVAQSNGYPAGSGNISCIRIPSGNNAGRVLLFYSTNAVDPSQPGRQQTYLIYSDDDGSTWSSPRPMTEFARFGAYFVPGSGPKAIQLRYTHKGRILVPLYSVTPTVFFTGYSDDNGATWNVGASIPATSNETAIAEDIDGTVYATVRTASATVKSVYASRDGGISFMNVTNSRSSIPDPGVNGDLLQAASHLSAPAKLIFSNLNSTGGKRSNPYLRVSYDGLATWDYSTALNESANDEAGYSSLDMMDENTIAVARETAPGDILYGASITLTTVNIPAIKG